MHLCDSYPNPDKELYTISGSSLMPLNNEFIPPFLLCNHFSIFYCHRVVLRVLEFHVSGIIHVQFYIRPCCSKWVRFISVAYILGFFLPLSSIPFHEHCAIYPFSYLWTFELLTVCCNYKVMSILSEHVFISLLT